MKTALITTTINVPKVLALYRKLGPDVKFFIALDEKTDNDGIAKFKPFRDENNCWMTPGWQRSLNYKSSELIGWNTDSRRNIALLEALRWGAEIIVSVDDDMLPYEPDFFQRIETTLTQPWSGLQLGGPNYWLDTGAFTSPEARQRGIPLDAGTCYCHELAQDVQIGAMQCTILGIPDTDGATTSVRHPAIHTASDILKFGFVAHPESYAVFNSQLTAFRRELAPCFFQFYKAQGRNTDIIASVIMRRIMRKRGLYTYYGPPTGFHARSPRSCFKDLKAEMWGLERIDGFCSYLDNTSVIDAAPENVVDQLRAMWTDLLTFGLMKDAGTECALAFLDDVETVL